MNISLIVTEYCNLRCPNCMHRIPYLNERRHFPVSYFEELSDIFSDIHIGSLILEGGEPTLHPDFVFLSGKWREWFDCDSLILTTNGCRLEQVELVLKHFDQIQVTEYPGLNDKEVAWAKERNISGLYVGFVVPGGQQFPLDVKPYAQMENPPMCRWKNCRIVWRDKIWICAGAENIDQHVILGEDRWLEKLNNIDRRYLCQTCFVPESWRIVE